MSIYSILKEKNKEDSVFYEKNLTIDAVKKMVKNNIHALIILTDQNKLAGIITDHDIMKFLAKSNGIIGNIPVSDLMTTKLVTCKEDASLKKVLYLMSHHHLRHIIVQDKNNVMGLLSIKDVLKKIHENEELELNVLRDIAVAARN